MKKYVYLGKCVNTHGIKGEIRILSNFLDKELVFKKNFKLYFGEEKCEEIINSYRKHKEFDMVTLENINNINDVLKYKGKKVYFVREDINNKEYILEDLISFKIIDNEKTLGIIDDFMYNNGNVLLHIKAEKNFYIPYNDFYVKKVDIDNKSVVVENVEGLIL